MTNISPISPTLQILGKKVAGPGEESNCSAKNAKVNIDHEIVKIVGKPQEMTINIEEDKFNKVLLLQAKESIEKVRSQRAPGVNMLLDLINEKDLIIQQQKQDQEKLDIKEKEKFDKVLVQAKESFEKATVLMKIIKEKDIIIQQQKKDQNKLENHVKQIKLEESNKVEQEQADTVNFLDKKNNEFDKKLKKT